MKVIGRTGSRGQVFPYKMCDVTDTYPFFRWLRFV